MKTIYTRVILLNCLIFTTIYILFPSLRFDLTGEDRVIENLTAILFISTALLSLFFFFKTPESKSRRTLIFTFLLGCFFFLEEVSFGERIFHLEMPTIAHGKVDGVHDVFRMASFKLNQMPSSVLLSLSILLVAAIAFFSFKYKQQLTLLLQRVLQYPPCFYVLACGAFLSASVFLDLGWIRYEPLHLPEELFEMNAALSLVFCAVSAYKTGLLHKAAADKAFAAHLHENDQQVGSVSVKQSSPKAKSL